MRDDLLIKVISLFDDKEKRRKINQEFNNYGLNFSFFDAIYGKKLLANDYFLECKNVDYFFNRKTILTPGEVGCKLSHLKVLEEFVYSDNNYQWLCVFEDDVTFKSDPNVIFEKINSSLENDILHLGGQEGIASAYRVIKLAKDNFGELKVFKVFPLTLRWLYRTCGYIVSKKSAMELLTIYQKYNLPADNWGYILKNSNINSILYCDIVSHPLDLKNSTIESERNL